MSSKIMEFDVGVEESVKQIFSAVIVGMIDKEDKPLLESKSQAFRQCLPKFLGNFSYNIFFNEYAFLYTALKSLKVKFFSKSQLETLIDQNKANILSSPLIDISRFTMNVNDTILTADEKIEVFKSFIFELVDEISNTYVSIEQFDSSCVIYTEAYKDNLMYDTAQCMTMIMSETGYTEKLPHGRNKKWHGRKDANKFYNSKMAIIKSLEEENQIKHKVIDEGWAEEEIEKDEKGDDNALVDFGIPEIDEVVGQLRRGNMVEFMGPAKGGKTTATTFLIERCLEKGLNVAVWPLEGSDEEWLALIQALMVRKLENNPLKLDRKKVLAREYKSGPEKQSILAVRQILASASSGRGRLSFISGPAMVENFTEVLQYHYDNENAFDVIVMDSPINVQSEMGKGKVERISDCFMIFKNYINNVMKRKPLAIVTAQLKQEVVDHLRRNPGETIDVTAGGESAETIRTPDEVIGLFSSKTERAMGQMKIYSVASRHSGNFDDFYIGCELGCGYLFSDPSLNE